MGSKPKAPKYDVQYRTTDYIPTEYNASFLPTDYIETPYNVQSTPTEYIRTDYNVSAPAATADYAPSAMSMPEYNTGAALAEQSRLNTTIGGQQYANVSSPLGGYSVSVDPVTGQLTVNKSLSENSQTALSKQLGALNTYTGDPTEAANAYYNAQMSYLQPQLDRQVERAESSLTNRGLPIGSSAWNEAMGNVYDSQNRALDALSNEALSRGQAYQGNILGQAQLLGGQVIDPSMLAGQAGAGLSDTYANQYNAALAQQQANYDNALLRYNAMNQDETNRYQNELNAYNAMLSNNQGQYSADLANNQATYQNALNAYNAALANNQGLYNANLANNQGYYQNALNAYNAALTDNQGRYAANLSNNQGLYQNDLNKYQNALQQYQTKMANYNSNMGALAKGIGMIGGAALGSIVPGVGTLAGAQLGGMLGGMDGDVSSVKGTNN